MSGEPHPFEPDWTLRPGTLLAEELRERQLPGETLAGQAGLAPATVAGVLDGTARVTPATAGALARALGTSPEFWLNLQSQYDADIKRGARDASEEPVADLSAVPWLADGCRIVVPVPGRDAAAVPAGAMSTAALAELVAAVHNAELIRRKAAGRGRGPADLAEAFTEGVPEGATISSAREEVIPPRTWEKLGADGTEIYLDSDAAARFLVRKIRPPAPAHESCDADVWDGAYKMRCSQAIVNGRCGRHGLRPGRGTQAEGKAL